MNMNFVFINFSESLKYEFGIHTSFLNYSWPLNYTLEKARISTWAVSKKVITLFFPPTLDVK